MTKMQLEWNGKNVQLDCQVDTAASCNVLTYSDQIGEAGNEEQQDSTDHVMMGQAGSLVGSVSWG